MSVKDIQIYGQRCMHVVPKSVEKGVKGLHWRLREEGYAPMPITVPYSAWASSAWTAWVKQTMARRAKNAIEREDKICLDWACIGWWLMMKGGGGLWCRWQKVPKRAWGICQFADGHTIGSKIFLVCRRRAKWIKNSYLHYMRKVIYLQERKKPKHSKREENTKAQGD